MYIVIKKFKDLQDNDYIYKKGDIFPRNGIEAKKERLKELSSKKNKIGEILIRYIENNPNETDKE